MNSGPRSAWFLAPAIAAVLAAGFALGQADGESAVDLNDRGVRLLEDKHYDEAIETLRRAVDLAGAGESDVLRGNLRSAYRARARDHEQAGRTDAAAADYEEVLRLDDGDASARAALASILLAAKEYDRAIALYQRLVRDAGENASDVLRRNFAVAHHNRGVAELKSGDLAEAIHDFEDALRIDQDLTASAVHMAQCYMLAHDFGRAEMVLLSARARAPDDPEVFEKLGFLYYARDDLKQAIANFERRLELGDDEWTRGMVERARREDAVSGSFVNRSSNDFTLKFLDGGGQAAVAEDVLRILQDARAVVGSDLGHFPDRTTVLLYGTEEFRMATGSHAWVGGLYDGKIRLQVKDFARQRESLARTARHEFTHRVIRDLATGCPDLINEGLAQSYEDVSADPHAALRALRAKGREAPPLAQAPKSFAAQSDADAVTMLYAEAESFAGFLRQRYGIGALRALLADLGRGRTLDEALDRNCGGRLEDLETLWRAEVLH